MNLLHIGLWVDCLLRRKCLAAWYSGPTLLQLRLIVNFAYRPFKLHPLRHWINLQSEGKFFSKQAYGKPLVLKRPNSFDLWIGAWTRLMIEVGSGSITNSHLQMTCSPMMLRPRVLLGGNISYLRLNIGGACMQIARQPQMTLGTITEQPAESRTFWASEMP